MKSKKFYFALLASVMLAATAFFTSCASEDNSVKPVDGAVDISEVIKEFKESGAADILHGKLFYVIPSDSLENYKLPVATTKLLDVETEQNDYYGFREEIIDVSAVVN